MWSEDNYLNGVSASALSKFQNTIGALHAWDKNTRLPQLFPKQDKEKGFREIHRAIIVMEVEAS